MAPDVHDALRQRKVKVLGTGFSREQTSLIGSDLPAGAEGLFISPLHDLLWEAL